MKIMLILALILLAILAYFFLAEVLGLWGLALLEAVITIGIILLAINFIRRRDV